MHYGTIYYHASPIGSSLSPHDIHSLPSIWIWRPYALAASRHSFLWRASFTEEPSFFVLTDEDNDKKVEPAFDVDDKNDKARTKPLLCLTEGGFTSNQAIFSTPSEYKPSTTFVFVLHVACCIHHHVISSSHKFHSLRMQQARDNYIHSLSIPTETR